LTKSGEGCTLADIFTNSSGHPARDPDTRKILGEPLNVSNLNCYHTARNVVDQGCQIFLGPNIPNWEKYNKRPQTIPNGHKIYQHLPLKGPPKFTQIGNFGLKTKSNNLATLFSTQDCMKQMPGEA
jgi:hypothetical protein